jgi:hypothetical protein
VFPRAMHLRNRDKQTLFPTETPPHAAAVHNPCQILGMYSCETRAGREGKGFGGLSCSALIRCAAA